MQRYLYVNGEEYDLRKERAELFMNGREMRDTEKRLKTANFAIGRVYTQCPFCDYDEGEVSNDLYYCDTCKRLVCEEHITRKGWDDETIYLCDDCNPAKGRG